MLPKSFRLLRNFATVFRKGVKISTPFFVLRAIPAFDGHPRFAVTVSKKTEKSAVRRNRIRRRLVEAAKKSGFPESCELPTRIVLLGFSKTADAEFLELSEAFRFAREKAEGVIRAKDRKMSSEKQKKH